MEGFQGREWDTGGDRWDESAGWWLQEACGSFFSEGRIQGVNKRKYGIYLETVGKGVVQE